MTQVFITGIGTGVGKSFCTCALLHQAAGQYRAIKPVLSGFSPSDDSNDAAELLRAMRQPIMTQAALDAVSPFRFAAPLSPHLAAQAEGAAIDPQALLAFCREQMAQHPHLLIEGVGGLMVPITPRWLVRDWMQALGLPVILVGGSYLGAINHTLLSLEALRHAGLTLRALVISQSPPESDTGLDATHDSVAPFMPHGAQLIRLARQSSWSAAPNLLSLISMSEGK